MSSETDYLEERPAAESFASSAWDSPSLVQRIARLEVFVEAHAAVQRRREDDDLRRRRQQAKERQRRDAELSRVWSDLAFCVQSVAAHLDRFEPAILGNEALGQKSLGARLDALERMALSTRIGWRAASIIGTAILGLLSWLAFFLH